MHSDGEVVGVARGGVPWSNWAQVLLEPGAQDEVGDEDVRYREIPVDRIRPNPRQPREHFDDDALAELVASIRQVGLLQPIVVRPAETEGSFELVAGERRWRAVQQLGHPTVPAVVRPVDDDDLLRDALLENIHRVALNPLEEAAAYEQLLRDFGCTQEALSVRIGRSRPQISNTIRLLKLPAAVQRRVAAGVLSQGHARALLGLGDEAAMEAMANRIVAEGLSVRSVEEIVATGGVATQAERPRRARRRAPTPGRESYAESLGDRLDTRVQVSMGRVKGKVTIEFAGVEDLDRIMSILDADGTQT